MLRLYTLLFLLVFTSCAGGLYSRYPKAKRSAQKSVLPHKEEKRQLTVTDSLRHKTIPQVLVAIDEPVKAEIQLLQPTKVNTVTIPQNTPVIMGDGRPRDATHTNKDAKRAFIAAIGALGFFAGGLLVHPAFLIAMFLCALLALVKGIKAVRRIMKTGEYGRYKAEFALYVAIPLLFLTLVGLFAYLAANGTGLQIGNVFIP